MRLGTSGIDTAANIGPVRHPLTEDKLDKYLASAVPSLPRPLKIQQFSFGQSNPVCYRI